METNFLGRSTPSHFSRFFPYTKGELKSQPWNVGSAHSTCMVQSKRRGWGDCLCSENTNNHCLSQVIKANTAVGSWSEHISLIRSDEDGHFASIIVTLRTRPQSNCRNKITGKLQIVSFYKTPGQNSSGLFKAIVTNRESVGNSWPGGAVTRWCAVGGLLEQKGDVFWELRKPCRECTLNSCGSMGSVIVIGVKH